MTARHVATAARWHTPLLTAHIVVSVGWLGAGLAVTALTLAGMTGAEPATVYPAAHLIAAWLVAPLAAASLTTGLLLVATTSWGLVTHRWVTVKLAISVLLAGVSAVLLVPRLATVAAIVTGPDPSALTSGQRLPLVLAPAAASVLLGVNVVLATAKPARLRRHAGSLRTARS
jgi:hypothetical protein